jgi:hypothetical protein
MKHLLTPSLMAACCVLSVSSLWAQSELHDPTRPPSSLSISANVESSSTPESIQMLVIGRKRTFAMMDGVVVKPGESVNQWQLVSIGSQGVVMRNAAVTKEISINPSVVKTVRSEERLDRSTDSNQNKPPRKSP